ncbi:MAG: hypothetical protein EBS53_16320, partial [Bacteroidetes bacterium]|nr:hypothetical protein [Bacteroidota bacterium]
ASALASGTIAVNSIVDVMYDGTQFLLMNDPAGATGGDVTGPASATDNAVVRFDGTTGKLVQNSAVTVADTTGDITGGKYNGLTVTTTTGTLTITNGKTLAASNTLTLAGTDSTTMTFPSTSANIARTDAGQTFTGTQVMTSPRVITSINDTNGNELFAVTATGSAVNEFTVANAATGANPVISATGSDTDIGITLTPKGTGNAVLTSGNLVVANGNGIDFSATPGTGSSELLDDYEEGTWTPVATAATAPTGVTYNFQGGWYRKIGSLVVAGFGININSVGTGGSGELKISGFPFTSATNGSYQEPSASLQGGRWVTSALAGQTYLFINDNSTVAGTRYQNNADTVISWSDVQGGNASTGTYFGSVISYHTT